MAGVQEAGHFVRMGLEYHRAGRLAEADALYRQALAADPMHADALGYLGVIRSQAGFHEDGISLLGRALSLKESNETRVNLGAAYQQAGHFSEAIECFRKAAEKTPEWPDVWNFLGAAQAAARRMRDAITSLRRAIALRPDFLQALSNLGSIYNELGEVDRALDCCRRVVSIAPQWPQGCLNLGIALFETGERQAGLASMRRATELGPQSVHAWNVRGLALAQMSRLDEAEECYRRAVALAPVDAALHANLGNNLLDQGRIEEGFAQTERAAQLDPQNPTALSNVLMATNYLARFSPQDSLQRHREWAQRFEAPLAAKRRPHANDRTVDRKIRVGYITQFFRGNPLDYFMEPILANHNRSRFEVFLYSQVRQRDAETLRFDAMADVARSICALGDDDAAQLIRDDRVDILLDLIGHLGGNRATLMALKPAPVQVSYLGHCATTGLSTIDYRIVDSIVEPQNESEDSVEELVRLSSGFCCYAPPRDAPEVNALPALQNGFVTFGSTHKLQKLNDEVLELWCSVLGSVKDSRLIVFRDSLRGKVAERIRQKFAACGIEPGRIELRCEKPIGGYLAAYHDFDISLDAFPWTGHTTVCESMWMGVPMISLSWPTYAGRMVTSVLTQLRMCHWVARTPEEFVQIATRPTENLVKLSALRQSLRGKMIESEFCRGAALTRELEAAYVKMWRKFCEI